MSRSGCKHEAPPILTCTANLANIAIMSATHDVHGLQPSKDLPSSPASQLKNAFKPVFQRVLKEGAVSITRNRKREAILLTAELYDQLIAEVAARDPLEILRKDYDARFAAMQSDEAREGYEGAFDASLEELGEVAVAQAAKE